MTCNECGGSGRCRNCGGTGYMGDVMDHNVCPVCGGTTKCQACGGTGQVDNSTGVLQTGGSGDIYQIVSMPIPQAPSNV